MTDPDRIRAHRRENLTHTLLLVGAMLVLLAALGWTLAGGVGLAVLAAAGAVAAVLGSRLSPSLIMRLYRARPLSPVEAPGLTRLVGELAHRAGLTSPPQLFYVPSAICNAFTVGHRGDSSIAVTDCLLRRLSARELAGVLAHEISHAAGNDLRVMGLADLLGRMTRFLALFGQVLLLINLPLMLMGRVTVPWLFVILLLAAPTVSGLLQLALSRTREYEADLGAVQLTGDPRGLASALAKLERLQGGLWRRILLPGHGVPEPSVLRTHPVTSERVRRLLELELEPEPREAAAEESALFRDADLGPPHSRPPRWRHSSGLWY